MARSLKIRGHPLHTILTDFPVVLFAVSILWDIFYMTSNYPTDRTMWWNFSKWSIGIGLLAVIPTAIAGLVDYMGIPRGHSAAPTATAHFVTNLCVAGSYFVSWLFFMQDPTATQALAPAFFFSGLGFMLLLVSGWLGGSLVFKHGVGQPTLPEREEMPVHAPTEEEMRR
jgi:uncharacterized membrane protein